MSTIMLESRGVLEDLRKIRGWTPETCAQLQIGWDGNRLWIPIFDYFTGALLNARMYDPFKRNEVKSFHYANASGTTRTTVYVPGGSISSDEVWLFEGEPDAILAFQLGLPAIAVTGGAGTWCEILTQVIGSRRVVICADQDLPGERGAKSWASRLRSFGIESVHLRFAVTGKDFTDAIMKDGKTVEFFRTLAKDAWDGTTAALAYEDKPVLVPVGGGMPGERVEMLAHVIGCDIVPALVPSGVRLTCRVSWKPEGACLACPVGRASGDFTVQMEPTAQAVIELAMTPQRRHLSTLAETSGVPARCPAYASVETGYWNLISMRMVPQMLERQGGDTAARVAYHVTRADGKVPEVAANTVVRLDGRVRLDPKTNTWIMMATEALPTEDGIDSFRLTPDIIDVFRSSFSPKEWTAADVYRSIRAETKSLSRHVTHVYGRDALLELVDLTYHSALAFTFDGRQTTRGWLSALVIGETRTGKSETAAAYVKHVGIGRMIMDPANMSFAGLVGGVQQVGTGAAWSITWGVIPVNDRGVVIIDELSSMSKDDIGRMSGMRSSGVAEITKIRTQNTLARTRLVMIGNPRGTGVTLASYSTPVEAVMELIGTPEDIARFDLATAVSSGFDKNAANIALGDQPQPVPADVRRDLVRFAWSRQAGSIDYTEAASDATFAAAKRMVADFDNGVPLVESSEQELRIARVAVAAAIRTFSVEDDKGTVIVRQCHVEYAERIMRELLCGDLKYHDYSASRRRRVIDKDAAVAAMARVGLDMPAVARSLMRIRRITPSAMSMATGMDMNDVRTLVSQFHTAGALDFSDADPRSAYMVWTVPFLELLRNVESGAVEVRPNIIEM